MKIVLLKACNYVESFLERFMYFINTKILLICQCSFEDVGLEIFIVESCYMCVPFSSFLILLIVPLYIANSLIPNSDSNLARVQILI